MKSRQFKKAVYGIGAAVVLFASGCATAFERSSSTDDSEHVFPATTFDAQCFWESGVKGEPLMAPSDSNDRNGPAARFAWGVGSVVDLPFSIVVDMILLPYDLLRPKTPDKVRESNGGHY
jgi:uncharacterized protein YceK